VLERWLSRTRDLAAAEAFFRGTINSTEGLPEQLVMGRASVPAPNRTPRQRRRTLWHAHTRARLCPSARLIQVRRRARHW